MSLYNTGPRRDELIERLRIALALPEGIITDEELLERTKHTLLFANIEHGMAVNQLWHELRKEFLRWTTKLKTHIQ